MKPYYVLLRCEGFEIPSIGNPDDPLIGYCSSHWAIGQTRSSAAYRAIATEWDEWVRLDMIPEDQRKKTQVFDDEATVISWFSFIKHRLKFPRGVRPGRTWWSVDET